MREGEGGFAHAHARFSLPFLAPAVEAIVNVEAKL